MLVQQLRDLEAAGLIERRIYSEVPPKGEYSMTEYGKRISPILVDLCNFGQDCASHFGIRLCSAVADK
jgi:DNA-binding HxlR family transcriptional regulator